MGCCLETLKISSYAEKDNLLIGLSLPHIGQEYHMIEIQGNIHRQ